MVKTGFLVQFRLISIFQCLRTYHIILYRPN